MKWKWIYHCNDFSIIWWIYRWSSEREPRRQRGPDERQGSRSRSRERAQDVPHQPPFRSPSWKRGASYYQGPQERYMEGPRKRRMSDFNAPPSDFALDHDHPKYPRRERPQLLSFPRPYRGKPLFQRGRGYLLKGRQFQAESLMRLRIPPYVKPRFHLGYPAARGNIRAILAMRKKRFQPNAAPLRKLAPETKPQQSPSKEERSPSTSSKVSDSDKEKMESHRSLSTRRYGIILLALFAGAWWWLKGQERIVSVWRESQLWREMSPCTKYSTLLQFGTAKMFERPRVQCVTNVALSSELKERASYQLSPTIKRQCGLKPGRCDAWNMRVVDACQKIPKFIGFASRKNCSRALERTPFTHERRQAVWSRS